MHTVLTGPRSCSLSLPGACSPPARSGTARSNASHRPSARGRSPFAWFTTTLRSRLVGQWYQNQPDQAAANLVTVSAGVTTTGISAALRPLGAITGRVTNLAHAGVGGECVTAMPFGAGLDPASGTAPAPDIAISRVTGRYTLLDLAPGQYKIEFSVGCGDSGFATQWWNNASSAKSASVVTVGFKTVTGIDATLRR